MAHASSELLGTLPVCKLILKRLLYYGLELPEICFVTLVFTCIRRLCMP